MFRDEITFVCSLVYTRSVKYSFQTERGIPWVEDLIPVTVLGSWKYPQKNLKYQLVCDFIMGITQSSKLHF